MRFRLTLVVSADDGELRFCRLHLVVASRASILFDQILASWPHSGMSSNQFSNFSVACNFMQSVPGEVDCVLSSLSLPLD